VKMRWKADLPKMPRLPKVPLASGDPAPGELGPPPAPSAYREKNPYESQPVEYRAPTILIEHRGLALLFVAAAIVFAVYCLRSPRRTAALDAPAAHGVAQTPGAAQTPAPASAQSPIYVEAVPDKDR
jgi:hypothetical protein